MEITSNVEFGIVIADGKVQRQEIAILNRGSKNGAFKLVYKGSEPISIVPMQGVVKAGYSQPIRVCFNFLHSIFDQFQSLNDTQKSNMYQI